MAQDNVRNKVTLTLDSSINGTTSDIPALQSVAGNAVNARSGGYSAGAIDESMLSEEEKQMVETFANEIDIADVDAVMNYGSVAQNNISDFSSTILKKVKTRDLGEIGDSLKDLTIALDESVEPERKGLKGIMQRAKRGVDSVRANYAKAESNVDRIEKDLQKHQIVLSEDIAMYQEMYDLNLQYYKELTMYIIAGKKALDKARNTRLLELKAAAEQSEQQEIVQAYKDFEDQCYRFEKKLETLETTRIISIQSAPQVRLLQNNDREMLDKIQASLSNTIPLWRNQLVISLGIEHSRRAIEAQSKLSDKTNELLLKNSEALKMATVETAKEAERPIVDVATLQQCNKNLISSINEVVKIHDQGTQKREKVQDKLVELELELKEVMMN